MSPLPQELLDACVDALAADHELTDRTLMACAAAGRRLRYRAQHHLFSTVSISQSPSRHDGHPTPARLLSLLKSSPHLATHIRTLRIVGSRLQYLYGGEEQCQVFHALLDVIPLLPNLTGLSMSFVGNKWFLSVFPSNAFACHRITRVTLRECVVHFDGERLERFLQRFPELREVEAVNCVYRGVSEVGGDGWWGRTGWCVWKETGVVGLSGFC
ncbi:hypothetical protein BDZ89DRAFT_197627 [Hymenopellis radicata]|nr:hypothetical protein BDZ89DRAFT_197627 [Hymenopellis radicata]